MHHGHRPNPHRPSARPSRGTGAFLFWFAVVPAIAGLLWLSTPRSATVSAPPKPRPIATMSPNQLHSDVAANGVVGGANVAAKLLAQATAAEPVSTTVGPAEGNVSATRPVAFDRPAAARGRAAIRITDLRSELPHSSEDRAIADAVEVARGKLAEHLRALDPPIDDVPPAWVVRAEYVRPGSVVKELPTQQLKDEWKAARLNPDRVWVKLDIEVSEDQIRQLRAKQRLVDAGGLGIGILALCGAAFTFLRLDAATRGYLTFGLGAVAAAVAVLVVGAVVLLM